MTGRTLIVAPHPDDEVLGCGGAIARHVAEGFEVHVAVMTRGGPPDFDEESLTVIRREAEAAHNALGVARTWFLDLPAAGVDTVPHRDVNAVIAKVIHQVGPDVLYVPFPGDVHRDHQEIFQSALVAARPSPCAPRTVYTYETLSETNWNAPYLTPGFAPTVFVDITEHLDKKLDALRCYASQLRDPPHERSVAAVTALATLRGSTVGLVAAEAFVLIRDVR